MAATRSDQSYPELMSYEEAAAALNITGQGVKAAIAQGRLHPVKLTGTQRKFIRREEVETYEERKYQRNRETQEAIEARRGVIEARRGAGRGASAAAPVSPVALSDAVGAVTAPFIELARQVAGQVAGPMSAAIGATVQAYAQGATPDPKRRAS